MEIKIDQKKDSLKLHKGMEWFNSFHSNDALVESKVVYEKLLKENLNNNLNKEDNEIINKVLKSYQKVFQNNKLEEDDFILSGPELNEIKEQKNYTRYVLYRYKFNIYPNLNKLDDYPPCLQVELTSICNLRCVMCYQSDRSFSTKSNGFMGHMKFDLFKKIIDEVEGKIEAVTFASRGEPTLNKDLENCLNYCEGKFLGLKLNTNATMFNEKMINLLLSSDLETLVLSIDAPNKEMYEKIRVNSKFDKIIKNLELMKTIREKNYKNSKMKVRISGVKINKDQKFEDIKNFYSRYVDEVSLVNYNPWESSYENTINDITDPCSELWRKMFIWWDGKVNPCDYDYKSILSKWNVKFMSIKEIWNSEYYNDLRNLHLNNARSKVEPCARCIAV